MPQAQGKALVRAEYVSFHWHPGFSVTQTQKSVADLHQAASRQLGVTEILEISTKSPSLLGVALSAFNLTIETVRQRRTFSIESAYQGSKVFERGGPYVDLLSKPSRVAKKDERLIDSGRLVGFRFMGVDWPLKPVTAFYDWLYVNALRKRRDLLEQAAKYIAFTDIAFNPDRSINCQAHSAALCVALANRGLLLERLATKESFLELAEKYDEHSDLQLRPTKYSAKSIGRRNVATETEVLSMPKFENLKFPTWNAYQVVSAALAKWRPDSLRSKEGIEESLYQYLMRELPDVQITKPREQIHSKRGDIVVGDSVMLELKSDVNTPSKYQEVLDDLASLREWSGEIILLLIGQTDPKLLKSIEKRIKAHSDFGRIAVINK